MPGKPRRWGSRQLAQRGFVLSGIILRLRKGEKELPVGVFHTWRTEQFSEALCAAAWRHWLMFRSDGGQCGYDSCNCLSMSGVPLVAALASLPSFAPCRRMTATIIHCSVRKWKSCRGSLALSNIYRFPHWLWQGGLCLSLGRSVNSYRDETMN
jgi:hypothetical protein